MFLLLERRVSPFAFTFHALNPSTPQPLNPTTPQPLNPSPPHPPTPQVDGLTQRRSVDSGPNNLPSAAGFPGYNSTLTGEASTVTCVEVRKGTVKEIQTISVLPESPWPSDGKLLTNPNVDASTRFVLKFRGETTGPIYASTYHQSPGGPHPNTTCSPTVSQSPPLPPL